MRFTKYSTVLDSVESLTHSVRAKHVYGIIYDCVLCRCVIYW
jgi:hypothetical protein